MQIKIFDSFHQEHTKLYEDIISLTASIKNTYPGHEKWYREKFLPGLEKNERMYIVAQDEEKHILAGCVLIKKTQEEKKICTFFINPQYRRKGLGRQLMQKTLESLREHPLITVSNNNLPQLLPLLKKFRFHWSASKKAVYNSNDTEIYFNDKKSDAIREGLIPVLRKRMGQLQR